MGNGDRRPEISEASRITKKKAIKCVIDSMKQKKVSRMAQKEKCKSENRKKNTCGSSA